MSASRSALISGHPTRAARLLLRALIEPASLTQLTIADWNALLPAAREAQLLGRLAIASAARGEWPLLPEKVQAQLLAARLQAEERERMARWEVNRVSRALHGTGAETLLLKGAAYLMAELPPAPGRWLADLDIMVRRPFLAGIEQRLRLFGWERSELDPYDERYYREWMHEIPPLRHRQRLTELDVHHTIVPPTSRIKIEGEALWARARALPDHPGLLVLAPEDMLLHVAIHLFHDGDMDHGLKELVDIDRLLRHFSAHEESSTTPAASFYSRLTTRAKELGCQRPLYYALCFSHQLLETPIPKAVLDELPPPSWPWRLFMRFAIPRALLPQGVDGGDPWVPLCRWLLYVRSHWLRMPPSLLIPHLLRKALRRNTVSQV